MSIWLIAYIAIAAVVGYFFAREFWRRGFSDTPGGDHNLFIAVITWLVYGAVWPIFAVILAIVFVSDKADKEFFKKIGGFIFRD